MRYRTKPTYVEAMQWTGSNDQEVIDFISNIAEIVKIERAVEIICQKFREKIDVLKVQVPSQIFSIPIGRFVFVDHHGDLHVRKAETFLKVYEKV